MESPGDGRRRTDDCRILMRGRRTIEARIEKDVKGHGESISLS
jgi:hypothetical protein